MGGESFNSKAERAAKYEALMMYMGQVEAGKSERFVAREQSNAVIQTAKLDKEAKVIESQNKLEETKILSAVKEKEIKAQFLVEMKRVQNEAVEAQGRLKVGEGSRLKGEAALARAQNDDRGGHRPYYYGYN